MSLSWAVLTAPAIATTVYSAACAAAYFATKRTVCAKIALIFLLIAAPFWTPAILVAAGAMPMPCFIVKQF